MARKLLYIFLLKELDVGSTDTTLCGEGNIQAKPKMSIRSYPTGTALDPASMFFGMPPVLKFEVLAATPMLLTPPCILQLFLFKALTPTSSTADMPVRH
jgi:hypothetical protein